jgi:SAM-dependent methyltransferase
VHRLRRYFARQPLVPRSCPLCGCAEVRLLNRGDRDFIGIRTSQCTNCGFILSSPYFPAEVISEFYREGYRTLFKGQPDPRGLAARQGYLRERSAFYQDFLVRLGLLPCPDGRVLDVGCGEGTLLRSLQHRFTGLRLIGVEPTASFAKQLARDTGIRVIERIGDLGTGEQFDLIILLHVLEHVHDPAGLLSEIREHLAPTGRLYADVPDVGMHGSISDLHLAHCNHFSVHTLSAFLARAGLAADRIERHRPPTLPPSIFAVARRAEPPPAQYAAVPDPAGELHARRVAQIDTGRMSHWARRLERLVAARRGVGGSA